MVLEVESAFDQDSDSEEPPPKPTPQELQAAITESNLFFEEGERTLPRTDTGEEIYEPIIQGETVVLVHPDTGRVTGLHADDGELKWEQSLDTTIRFMPVATENGSVIVACDNGSIYCLALADGAVLWEFDAVAALRRKNSKVGDSATMPICKGPVILDTKLYFAIGGWPFDGVFLFDVDIDDVEPGGTPTHRFTELVDRRHRGYLVASGDRILVPQGNAPAMLFSATSGEVESLDYDSVGITGTELATLGNWLIHGDHLIDIGTSSTEKIGIGRGILRESELSTDLYFASGRRIIGSKLFGGARYTAMLSSAASARNVIWQLNQQAIIETFSEVDLERWAQR